jgi:nucleoside-diphosphate-sugar epimerase
LAGDRLLKNKSSGHERYAVSAGNNLTLRQLVGTLEKLYNKPLNVLWGAKPYRFREVMKPWGSGKSLPGWKPRISLEEGMKKTLDLISRRPYPEELT